MNINSRTVSGKKVLSILFTATLISNAGFLTQTAHAGSSRTMTAAEMKNMKVPMSLPVPAVTDAPSVTQVTEVATAKLIFNYNASLGATYANTKMTVKYSVLKAGVKKVTKIGAFTANAKGVVKVKSKVKIAKTALVIFSAAGKPTVTLLGSKLRFMSATKPVAPTIAAPFVSPTPEPVVVTPTPTPTVAPIVPIAPVVVIEDALVPTFGVPNPTNDGYTIQIANFDSAFTWAAKDAAGGKLSISSTGQITVTNLNASQVTKVTVTTTRTNYKTGTATSVAITVLAAPVVAVPFVPAPPVVTPPVTPTPTPVVVVAPVITLLPANETITIGSSIVGYSLTNTGGAATRYSIFPSAPAGTTFNTTTGTLTGRPTAQQAATTYNITAFNTAGFDAATYSLTVNAQPSSGGGTASQSIYVAQPHAMRVGAADQVLTGLTTSGLPITYTPADPTICTVAAGARVSVVHAVAAGTCNLTASQAGNVSYGIATNASISFSIIDALSTSVIVVLDPNGGNEAGNNGINSLIITTTSGTVALPTTLTNAGYTSYTWHVNDVNGALADNAFPVPTADTLLVAKWA